MDVKYVAHSGNDMLVVNAARQSFNKQKELHMPITEGDISLLRFLATGMTSEDRSALYREVANTRSAAAVAKLVHKIRRIPSHWAPFAHPHITLHEQMPLFVARQRYKHMVGMVYSEESRRYIDSVPEAYKFEFLRERPEGNIKQGSGEAHYYSDYLGTAVVNFTEGSIALYKDLIDNKVAPEQARAILTQNMEITCMATGSLYAYANSYIQRSDAHAQKEIQELAAHWDRIIRPLYPHSWSALVDSDYV